MNQTLFKSSIMESDKDWKLMLIILQVDPKLLFNPALSLKNKTVTIATVSYKALKAITLIKILLF